MSSRSLGGKSGATRGAVSRDDKVKALSMAVGQIEKQFGKGAVMRLGSDHKLDVPSISTGSLSLDWALGIGGVPRGRVVEIYGPESSGKTTLALTVVAKAQQSGGMAAFVDAEHALDPQYATKLGVDVDNLLVSQPDSGEQALEIAEVLVRSGALDVLVIDSVAALVPRAELEGEMGDSHVGLQARLMSQALRKLTGIVAKSRTCLIFINQLREKVGVMFGSPETTSGGRALKFYSSQRIDIRRIGALKDGDLLWVRLEERRIDLIDRDAFLAGEMKLLAEAPAAERADLVKERRAKMEKRQLQVAACSVLDHVSDAERGVVPEAVDKRAVLPWPPQA